MILNEKDEKRFWAKASLPGTPQGCMTWTGSTNVDTYGQFRLAGKLAAAHRVSYVLRVGPIAEGMVLDHLCRNRACVRPSHLEAVTHLENMRRGAWAIKTHCKRGHEYTEDNTNITGKGHRQCRACRRLRHSINKMQQDSI